LNLRVFFSELKSDDRKVDAKSLDDFLDFGEDATESLNDLDLTGKIQPMPRKPVPKNSE